MLADYLSAASKSSATAAATTSSSPPGVRAWTSVAFTERSNDYRDGTGLRAAGGVRVPRLHDFRHRFAALTLTRWYESGEDVADPYPCCRPISATCTWQTHTGTRTVGPNSWRKRCRGLDDAGENATNGQPSLAALGESFFTQRLMLQRRVSAHTIALTPIHSGCCCGSRKCALHRAPSALALEDIDAPVVVSFLDDLEKTRTVTAERATCA